MLKKIRDQAGLTFMELMVVIAIMAVISAIYYVNIQSTKKDEVENLTEQLAADIRYIRNLATSRTTYKFSGSSEAEYPAGGYGIYVTNTGTKAKYWLYADNGATAGWQSAEDERISPIVTFDNPNFELRDKNDEKVDQFYFTFTSEHKVDTNMKLGLSQYVIEVVDPGPGYPQEGYKGILVLAEISEDGYVLSNLGKYYESFVPPDDGAGKNADGDPIWFFDL